MGLKDMTEAAERGRVRASEIKDFTTEVRYFGNIALVVFLKLTNGQPELYVSIENRLLDCGYSVSCLVTSTVALIPNSPNQR